MSAFSIDTNDRSKAFGAGAICGLNDSPFKKTEQDSVAFNGQSTLFPGGVCAQPSDQ